jgi:DNA-binding response OmpR family regulator
VSKLHTREYQMLITDMRMEHDVAGVEVIKAARAATYHPAVALLTAFPVAEEDWQEMGADQLLVKPVHTRILLKQIDDLITSHERKLASLGIPIATEPLFQPPPAKKAAPKRVAAKKSPGKKKSATKKPAKKAAKKAVRRAKSPAKKTAKPTARRKATARRRRP